MNEEYQEIDLVELFKSVLRRWWLIALFMIMAGGAAYYVTTEYITPIYEAKSTLFIGKENDVLSSVSIGDLQLDNKLVVDYRELIKTRLVTEEVIQDLSLLTDYNGLRDNLGIQIITESRFMHVTFKDPIPERAAQISNRLSEVLAEKAETVVGVKNVQIVDYALVPNTPISPSVKKNVAIAGVLGAMVALGLIFLQMMMDNTIQTEEDLEKLTQLPVLGVIPKFKGETR